MFSYSAKKIKAIKGQFHQIPSEHYLLEIFIFVELVCNYLLFKDNYHTLLNINKVFLTRNISGYFLFNELEIMSRNGGFKRVKML